MMAHLGTEISCAVENLICLYRSSLAEGAIVDFVKGTIILFDYLPFLLYVSNCNL